MAERDAGSGTSHGVGDTSWRLAGPLVVVVDLLRKITIDRARSFEG